MKKHLLPLLFLAAALPCIAQNTLKPREIYGSEAAGIWPGAEFLWQKAAGCVPNFIQFKQGSEPDETTFFSYAKKRFALPTSYSFQLLNSETDALGWQHKRYRLLVNAIPVDNGIFILHLLNGRVKKYNGYLFTAISTPAVPLINESAALTLALKNIGASVYKWQIPGQEQFIKNRQGTAATYYPKGELQIVQAGGNNAPVFTLAWKFDIYAQKPLGRYYLFIDAQTGAVVKKISRICNADAPGTAVTVYRGARPIHADSYNGHYRLRDLTRGQGIYTYNLQQGTNQNNAVDFTDTDNNWNNVNANLDQYAGDAHWGAEMTYDFYQSMGRNSIDNNGFRLELFVHYDQDYLNAFWDGQTMTFGDGDNGYTPLTSLDITGHEISHGLDEHTANLDYQDEPGALNESFSDIFGTAIEFFADSSLGNWLLAEDLGPPFRSMSDPNAYGSPDTYGGDYWYNGGQDYGGVHTNSGVQNHWFYLLAVGGTGTNDNGDAYNVTAIGRNKATQVAWRNMLYYLTSTSDYADARFFAIQAANDLFGACSPEAIATTRAWYAVGVGPDFIFGVDAQFAASPATGCTVPLTVNFINNSNNGSTYLWDFGDGTTSTSQSPAHTYTGYGNYTVKLWTDGGACGADSLVANNLIDINPGNPCVVILPATGTYQTQTACPGIIYDNGGAAVDYSDNSNSVVTISPPGASRILLHFTQFAMEQAYDYLYVYDGPTATSPVIGAFTGNTLPADIMSSGPSITIRQKSDQAVVDAGFTIQWSCVSPTAPPVANFAADATQTCSGNVKFTDLTTGGVNTWLWNFGDGNTSNQQHPQHSYNSNGSYTVTLTATNQFGSNTKTRTGYITVNRPLAPAGVNDSSCSAGQATLRLNTINAVTWYDSAGHVVANTNPFTTPALNQTTTYYAESIVEQTVYHAGPANNTIGNGGNFNASDRTLRFRVFKNCRLVSVYVYAQGAGYRTVQQRDSAGGVIQEKTVYCANGGSRITLNMLMSPGTYQFALRDTMNLYRNSSGAVYPYTDADGMVSIYGNNGGTGAGSYYYFFYDWQLQESDCITLRTPVTAVVRPAINTVVAATGISCFGGNNGQAAINATNGVAPYTYLWSNNTTANPATNLAAGNYQVTITDALGCTGTQQASLSQPAQLTISTITQDAGCGLSNGSITATASGGTGSFNYAWNNMETGAIAANLASGNYTVVVTDAANCSASAGAFVSNSGAFNLSSTSTNPACFGDNSGMAEVIPAGGTPGYTYNWSNGDTGSAINNLAAGTYTATVTDAGSCNVTVSLTITQPALLSATDTATNILCHGANNGSITIHAAGGAAGYTYLWSNGATGAAAGNLAAGIYAITVSDSNGCSLLLTENINEPPLLAVTVNGADVQCFGQANGLAQATATGGGGQYNYNWSNGAGGNQTGNLTQGNYIVTVTDNNNCTASAAWAVNQPSAIQYIATVSGATTGVDNGTAIVNVTGGGTPPYQVQWDNGGDGTQLPAGTYTFTITDAHGCIQNGTVTIPQITAVAAIAEPLRFNLYPNPASNTVFVQVTGLNAQGLLSVKNVLGQTVRLIPFNTGAQGQYLEVADWAAGVYIIEIIAGETHLARQLVVGR